MPTFSDADSSYIYQNEDHPRFAHFLGANWYPACKPELVRSIKTMKLDDGDVLIATFPKAGTTWLQHICLQLIKGHKYSPSKGNEVWKESPMIEGKGAEYSLSLPRRRVLKSHLPFDDLPWNPKAKYIYGVRNPKDSLTSFFHHHRNIKEYNFKDGEFSPYFELFIAGKLDYGDYHDHLLSWLPHLDRENILLVKYEDMLADLKGEIERIGKFCGGEAERAVESEQRMGEILLNSTLESMKQDQERWFPEGIIEKGKFIRKGCKRDWKTLLNKEQSNRMDRIWNEKMGGTVAENWWKEETAWEFDQEDNAAYE